MAAPTPPPPPIPQSTIWLGSTAGLPLGNTHSAESCTTVQGPAVNPQSLLSRAAVRPPVPCSASVQGTVGTKMAMSADIGWLVKNLKHQGCTLRCPSKNHDCLASAELVHWGRRGETLSNLAELLNCKAHVEVSTRGPPLWNEELLVTTHTHPLPEGD